MINLLRDWVSSAGCQLIISKKPATHHEQATTSQKQILSNVFVGLPRDITAKKTLSNAFQHHRISLTNSHTHTH